MYAAVQCLCAASSGEPGGKAVGGSNSLTQLGIQTTVLFVFFSLYGCHKHVTIFHQWNFWKGKQATDLYQKEGYFRRTNCLNEPNSYSHKVRNAESLDGCNEYVVRLSCHWAEQGNMLLWWLFSCSLIIIQSECCSYMPNSRYQKHKQQNATISSTSLVLNVCGTLRGEGSLAIPFHLKIKYKLVDQTVQIVVPFPI